jgi:type I restriction enzyme S subunit
MIKSWPRLPLNEVLTERQETPDPSSLTSGEIRILSKISFNDGRIQLRVGGDTKTNMILIRPGDLVLSGINAAKGAIAIYGEENKKPIAATIHYGSYIPNNERVDITFLWWLLRSGTFRDLLLEYVPGGIKTELKAKRFLPIPVPLPPLPEQRRIVARIEELAAKIEEAKEMRRQAMEKAEALLQSALYHIFAIKSNAWKRIPMTQAIAINDKQVDPTLPDYSLLPHISGENIVSKTCKLLPYRTAEGDNIKSNNYLFSPNTILYSKIRPYLRKAVFVDFQGVCSADIYPIKVINDALVPKFVMWSLIADPFTEYANRLSGRTRMPKLNRKQLFGFTLSYPDKREQSRIVNHLESLRTKTESLEIIQEETAEELEAFLPSVLDRAFKGEL